MLSAKIVAISVTAALLSNPLPPGKSADDITISGLISDNTLNVSAIRESNKTNDSLSPGVSGLLGPVLSVFVPVGVAGGVPVWESFTSAPSGFCIRLEAELETQYGFRNRCGKAGITPGASPAREEEETTPDWGGLVTNALQTQWGALAPQAKGFYHQPDQGWTLVNMPYIVYSKAKVTPASLTLLGIHIPIRFTPVSYTYNMGEGTSFTTTNPGAPYPNHNVFHIYRQAHTSLQVTATTTWTASYQHPTTGKWTDTPGILTTIETSPPFEIQTRTATLQHQN